MGAVGAAVGAAGGLLGSFFNWFSQSKENQKNREWSEKMYEKQRDDNREDWRMMNEYNAPSAQMERLSQAGLNPYLVYGSGATATASSSSAPTSTPSNSQVAPKLDLDVLGSYYSLRQMDLQNQNISQQNKNLAIDNKIKYEEYRQKKYEANVSQFYGMRNAKLKNEYLSYQVDDTRWQSLLSGIRYTIADKYGYDKAEKEVAQIDESIANIKANIARLGVLNGMSHVEMGNLLKQREVMEATIEKIQQDTEVSYQQAVKIYEEGVKAALDNDWYYYDKAVELYGKLDPVKYMGGNIHKAATGEDNFYSTLSKYLRNNKPNVVQRRSWFPVRKRKSK